MTINKISEYPLLNLSLYIWNKVFWKITFQPRKIPLCHGFNRINLFNTNILNCPNHNFYTGEKIYYSPSSNSGIKTSIYFLTKIDDNKIKLSYSNTDLYTKNYVNFLTVGSNDNFVKLDYQNKT